MKLIQSCHFCSILGFMMCCQFNEKYFSLNFIYHLAPSSFSFKFIQRYKKLYELLRHVNNNNILWAAQVTLFTPLFPLSLHPSLRCISFLFFLRLPPTPAIPFRTPFPPLSFKPFSLHTPFLHTKYHNSQYKESQHGHFHRWHYSSVYQ